MSARESLKDWAADLAIATAGGVLMGAMGPFGSYLNGPFWQRAVFQVACFWMGVGAFGLGARGLLRLRLDGQRFWAASAAMILVLTAPLAVAIQALARALWPSRPVYRLTWLDWYLEGLVTAIPVGLAFAALIRHRARQRSLREEAQGASPSAGGLLGAAPAQVLCLQMEDHYVRVHTAAGSRLVLATLKQATAALNGAEGQQVHRSWWVAKKAVAGVEQHGRNLRLRLVNGVKAPVARSAVAGLRAAGWIGSRAGS
jgi:DNA-binding LytR/AlgR family response regulator